MALPHLTNIEDSNQNNFIIFNNETTHINKYDRPYNRELKFIEKEALYTIGRYLDYLKKQDVYDNTRIIIVSDHGHWGQKSKYLDTPYLKYNPLLMVKDFNQSKDLAINYDFMTNADMPSIATKTIIPNPINPYTGKSLLTTIDKSEVKILAGYIGPEIQKANLYTPRIKGYGYHTVRKNIFNKENWDLR